MIRCDDWIQVNPLAEDEKGNLIAADAKIGFDDNAGFRQSLLFKLKDASQQDPRSHPYLHSFPSASLFREAEAEKHGLNYIGLDGNIGCMVNGAGLAMATMDIIKLHGGAPANFLDLGGGASEEMVVEAFKILTSDPQVKAILINIFGLSFPPPSVISVLPGGILRCDIIAEGIVRAAQTVQLKVPLVVRLEGTNVQQGKEILSRSTMAITTADDLDDAASKAVQVI